MMRQWAAIAAGGSLGALFRFWVANGIYQWLGRDFPHGTLFVNVSGSFLMGFLTEMMLQRFAFPVEYRAAVLVGFLGAYTTFSTFAIETLYLFESGSHLKALLNAFLSVALCLSAVWIGLILGRKMVIGDGLLRLAWSGSLGVIALGVSISFGAGLVAETLLARLDGAVVYRAVVVIAVLAVTTTGMSLKLALAQGEADHQCFLGAFAVNALASATAMWMGMYIGKQL